MTAELAVRNGSSLSISADQDYWSDKQLAALRQLGVDNASPGDLAVFFHQSQRTGLDPFAKQIYLIGRWSQGGTKYTIQTGIDGYRLIARRVVDGRRETLGYSDTLWCGPDGRWVDVWLSDEPPAAAKVTVIRNGQPYSAVALWREYVQTVKDKQSGEQVPNSMWARMGANQLAKCAEALALRKAFPQDLSGIYTTEEMGQADNGHEAAPRQQAARPQSIRDAIGAPQQQPKPEPLRTDEQSKKLFALAGQVGLGQDRDEMLSWVESVINRKVESTRELTRAEASQLIDTLEASLRDGANPATGEVVEAELVEDAGWPETSKVAR